MITKFLYSPDIVVIGDDADDDWDQCALLAMGPPNPCSADEDMNFDQIPAQLMLVVALPKFHQLPQSAMKMEKQGARKRRGFSMARLRICQALFRQIKYRSSFRCSR